LVSSRQVVDGRCDPGRGRGTDKGRNAAEASRLRVVQAVSHVVAKGRLVQWCRS
jgi:hypothetical protein